MVRTLLFLFFFLFSFSLFGQQGIIKGTVTDGSTNKKLEGTRLILDNTSGAISDEKGAFSIQTNPGEHILRVSMIGFSNEEMKIFLKPGETISLNINLKTEDLKLDVVVISASQYERNIAEETVSIDVIGKDLIRNSNATDLGEAINKTPGVQIQDEQVNIRGGSGYSYGVGSRTAVMVDGLSLMSADLGTPQLKFAPIEGAEQIEIVKGASSVVYGSSALNGVVNVITRWPDSEKPETDVQMYATVMDNPRRKELIWWDTGFQPHFSGMFFSHRRKIDNLQMVAGGNIQFYTGFVEESDHLRARFNFKTKYQPEKKEGLSYGLNGNFMYEDGEEFQIARDLDTNFYRAAVSSNNLYVRSSLDPHLTYLGKSGHLLTLKGRYLNIWRKGNGSDPNSSANLFTLENQYQRNLNDRFVMTFGLPFTFGWAVSSAYPGRHLMYSGAAYAQVEYKTEKLSVVGGVRYEYSGVDSVYITSLPVFRSGINYVAGQASYLRASFGQGFRIPTIGERFVAIPLSGDLLFVVPNVDLQAEKSWNFEIGFKQGFKISNWKAFVDLAIFWQEFNQFVEYRFGLWPNKYADGSEIFPGKGPLILGLKPFNVDRARIAGYEFSLLGQGNIGPVTLNGMAGYTYSYPGNLEEDPEQKKLGVFLKHFFHDMFNRIDSLEAQGDSSRILQFRSRHMIRGDLEAGYRRLSIGGSLYYTSWPERIPPTFAGMIGFLDGSLFEGKPNTLAKFNRQHEKGDFLMDIRMAYNLDDRIRLALVVKNLFNREYSNRPAKPEPPRSFTLQLRMTL
jgi:iron complex outermembrane receptor protein